MHVAETSDADVFLHRDSHYEIYFAPGPGTSSELAARRESIAAAVLSRAALACFARRLADAFRERPPLRPSGHTRWHAHRHHGFGLRSFRAGAARRRCRGHGIGAVVVYGLRSDGR